MLKWTLSLMAALVALLFSPLAMAQTSLGPADTHEVSVTVAGIEYLNVSGDVSFTVNQFDLPTSPATPPTVNWGTNLPDRNIYVSAAISANDPDGSTPTFPNMTVEGNVVAGPGTEAPPVALASASTHTLFIGGVGESSGQAQLIYVLEVDPEDGAGTDIWDVTYTLASP